MKSRIFRYYRLAWLITIITMSFIFYISSIPADPVPGIGFKYKSNIYHFGIFFILAFFSMIAFSKGGKNKEFMIIAILFSIVYAITDELHQSLILGRNVSVGDFLTDCLGIITAFILNSIK
jgi:VanZ family protein